MNNKVDLIRQYIDLNHSTDTLRCHSFFFTTLCHPFKSLNTKKTSTYNKLHELQRSANNTINYSTESNLELTHQIPIENSTLCLNLLKKVRIFWQKTNLLSSWSPISNSRGKKKDSLTTPSLSGI